MRWSGHRVKATIRRRFQSFIWTESAESTSPFYLFFKSLIPLPNRLFIFTRWCSSSLEEFQPQNLSSTLISTKKGEEIHGLFARFGCTEKMTLVTWRPHAGISRGKPTLWPFQCIPEASGALRLLSFFLGPVGPRVWAICKLG
ncbi:hypothetical protein V6Z11_A12G049800 [Gossypium hirsutum]